MPRKYKLKNNKLWTNCGLARAIAERDAAGTPMRKLSDKYNVPIATLHRYLNYQKKEKQFLKKMSEVAKLFLPLRKRDNSQTA